MCLKLESKELMGVIILNLGLNKEEAKFLIDVIHNTLKLTKCPDILIDTYEYLGVDVKDILNQLAIIAEIGEEPITDEERKLFK